METYIYSHDVPSWHGQGQLTKFVYPAKNICQIHLSWEQTDNYLLGSLYNAKLLPYVTYVTVVRHGVRTCLWASSF